MQSGTPCIAIFRHVAHEPAYNNDHDPIPKKTGCLIYAIKIRSLYQKTLIS